MLTLAPRELPLPSKPIPINFVYASLITPPTASPTATASPTTTASPTAGATPTGTAPSASPAAPGAGGGDGLPLTGSNTAAVAGIGAALLLLGGAGYLVARRRRTRFVA
jgi:LPXTG-motif cell wall-anchored protein